MKWPLIESGATARIAQLWSRPAHDKSTSRNNSRSAAQGRTGNLTTCCFTRRDASALLFGILALLVVACGDKKTEEVILEAPIGSDNDTKTTQGLVMRRPNSAFLEWDAVHYPNLRGYRVYYGPDPDMYLQLPGQGIDVGNVTSHTVTGLVSGRRYYFAVTSVDFSNNESELSGQVYKDIP